MGVKIEGRRNNERLLRWKDSVGIAANGFLEFFEFHFNAIDSNQVFFIFDEDGDTAEIDDVLDGLELAVNVLHFLGIVLRVVPQWIHHFRVIQDLLIDFLQLVSLDFSPRLLPGEQLQENHTEAIDIEPRRQLVIDDRSGMRVLHGRAKHVKGFRLLFFEDFRHG